LFGRTFYDEHDLKEFLQGYENTIQQLDEAYNFSFGRCTLKDNQVI